MAREKKQSDSAGDILFADGRDPRMCGNGIGFDGVYLCRLACLPCAALSKCAKIEIEEMASETARIIRQRPKSSTKKTDMYHT